MMKKRMDFLGGDTSDGRFNRSKYLSFKGALNNSYQAEWITFNEKRYRCLINPDKQSTDYDQKEISIDSDAGMKNGSTFYWDRTDTHWLVYLQKLEEEAYFRASIRRCDYQIDKWWIWLRGPVEAGLEWTKAHDIYFNNLNYTILFYVEKNEETLDYFHRLKVIKFDGHNWRVGAIDKYSQPGLIEVYLEEYYDNEMADATIVPNVPEIDKEKAYIEGPQVVRPFDTYLKYEIKNTSNNGSFIIDSNKVKIIEMNSDYCIINIVTGKSGTFLMTYKTDNEEIYLQVRINSLS